MRRTLGNSRRLPREISVTSDRTLVQRQSLRDWKAQAQQHNANNPDCPVEARYFDNLPTLIEVNTASLGGLASGHRVRVDT